MNILEIAKEYATITDLALAHDGINRNCYLFPTSMHLKAFAAAISAKAIEDYKASLVPVAWMKEGGSVCSAAYKADGPQTRLDKFYKIPLYALPKETK